MNIISQKFKTLSIKAIKSLKKDKIKLTVKEGKIYKKRWKIETLFQHLKHNYSVCRLNLTGKYSKHVKTAKFYSSLIIYNLLPQ